MINLYMWKENYDCASQGLKTQQNNIKIIIKIKAQGY